MRGFLRGCFLSAVVLCTVAEVCGQDWRGTAGAQSLTATAAAPPGAQGSAAVQGTTVSLELQRLQPGNYQIDVVNALDGVLVPLGVIAIVDPGREPDAETGDSRKEVSVTHQVEVLVSRIQLELPAGFDGKNVQQVLVTDLGGNVLLQSAQAEPKSK